MKKPHLGSRRLASGLHPGHPAQVGPTAGGFTASRRASVGAPGLTTCTALEGGGKRLLFAVLTWPTHSESYITVVGWSYTRHFAEWRLVLQQEVYGARGVTPILAAERAAVVLKTRDPAHPEALVLPLAHIPYATND